MHPALAQILERWPEKGRCGGLLYRPPHLPCLLGGDLLIQHSPLLLWALLDATMWCLLPSQLRVCGHKATLPYLWPAFTPCIRIKAWGYWDSAGTCFSLHPLATASSPGHAMQMGLMGAVRDIGTHAEATNTRQPARVTRAHTAQPPSAHAKAVYTAAPAHDPCLRVIVRVHGGKFGLIF